MHAARISAYSRIALAVMYVLIAHKFPRLKQSRVPKQRRERSEETKCTASHLRHYVRERQELACVSRRMN